MMVGLRNMDTTDNWLQNADMPQITHYVPLFFCFSFSFSVPFLMSLSLSQSGLSAISQISLISVISLLSL